jgi:arylformamidase
VTAWVGGDERPEFIRQSQLLAEAWDNAKVFVDEGRHHFDVIEG